MLRISVKSFWKYPAVVGLAVMIHTAPAMSQQFKSVVSCEDLAKLALQNTTITTAQTVAAGEFKLPPRQPAPGQAAPAAAPAEQGEQPLPRGTPGGPLQLYASKLPAFCRITATLTPSSDSDIKIEVWLPLTGWNGKFIGAGNGGWAGQIRQSDFVPAIAAGYAVAGTDTGHTTNGGSFIIGHPEKLIDYAYRADHEMTLKAKALIRAFYGVDPKYSYWIGCSLGGQEALIEAKRYPEDYDGIIAGAPLNPITHFNAQQIWLGWLVNKNPEKALTPEKATMLHSTVLKACATVISQKQGFIEDPERCKFDPGALLCKNGDAPDCLTAPQVELVRQFYAGPVNPRTGESIIEGSARGNELELGRANAAGVAVDLYKYGVFQDPNWDWKTMDFDKDVEKADQTMGIMNVDSDLTAFIQHGGKLMIHIGWTESHNGNTLRDFMQEVLKKAGPKYKDSVKLFEVPGMNHCGGGLGCDVFDKIGTIDAWVTQGKMPERITAYKLDNGKVIRTRPICAYPLVPRYKGTGNEDDADSYVCSK